LYYIFSVYANEVSELSITLYIMYEYLAARGCVVE